MGYTANDMIWVRPNHGGHKYFGRRWLGIFTTLKGVGDVTRSRWNIAPSKIPFQTPKSIQEPLVPGAQTAESWHFLPQEMPWSPGFPSFFQVFCCSLGESPPDPLKGLWQLPEVHHPAAPATHGAELGRCHRRWGSAVPAAEQRGCGAVGEDGLDGLEDAEHGENIWRLTDQLYTWSWLDFLLEVFCVVEDLEPCLIWEE